MSIKKVIVLEDDEIIRNNLENYLRRQHCEVAAVATLAAAQEHLERDRFDLAFLDVRLPDGDGTDLLKLIQTRTQKPLVSMMTGFGSTESAVDCMKNGAFEYLIKPFTLEQIELVLRKAASFSPVIEVGPLVRPNPGDVLVLTAKGAREHRQSGDIRGHDFRQSGFLAASELRRIRQRHEQFIRSLAARLAIFLRLEFSLQLAKVHIVSYEKFTATLASPTHITLFKTDPLKGVGLLVITPRLGLTLVDRLLGGSGQPPEEKRDLTEIESALLDQAATLILTEWCNHWPEMRELRPVLLGHENNSHFLQTSLPETAMLVLTMNGGIGDAAEQLQLVFPYATIEPLMRLLIPSLPESDALPARSTRLRWNSEFDEMPVPVVAEWQGLKMSAGAITRLRPGDVLTLDPACAAQVQIRLSDVPKFTGRAGTSDGKWAVQLTAAVHHPN